MCSVAVRSTSFYFALFLIASLMGFVFAREVCAHTSTRSEDLVCKKSLEQEHLVELANKGNLEAIVKLGVAFYLGCGVEVNYEASLVWLRKAEHLGSPKAAYLIGLAHDKGNGVAVDKYKACKYYESSALLEYYPAQMNLGGCYWTGEGMLLDRTKAVHWFSKAAENGDRTAQYNIGNIASKNNNMEKAIEWWTKSAEAGFSAAQRNLGILYLQKEFYDYEKGMYWLGKAAEKGEPEAQYRYAVLYSDRLKNKSKFKEAFELLKKSAKQNNDKAQTLLGIIYWSGLGVHADKDKALFLWEKAAVLGNEIAVRKLEESKKKARNMTPKK